MSDNNTDIQSFPRLPNDFRDASALVQEQLKESINSLDTRIAELNTEQGRRKLTALALKVVSVISSIVIATGILGGLSVQVLGGAIAGIAALERVFANMSRLLAVAAAKGALDRIRRQVVAQHNKKIVQVVQYRDREPEKSAQLLIKFVGELRDSLATTKDRIETDLHNNAYENLGRLSLEEQSANGEA